MKPHTIKDISWILKGYLPAAALGTAMELGLFWILADEPKEAREVSELLGIPLKRCQYWLEYLFEMGLLEKNQGDYSPSITAREAIMDVRSQETWAFLAGEARERLPGVIDLSLYMGEPGSVWAVTGYKPPDYLVNLRDDPENARRFTRMLYELHQQEAEQLAGSLDMTCVARLLDIGGGSGVMSSALLRRYPDLEAVVVDQANVVAAGQEITIENGMEGRLTFQVANFLEEEIPQAFDMILECDVGIYSEALFHKFWSALNDGGRLVILDFSFDIETADRLQLVSRQFYQSLNNPDFSFETIDDLKTMLTNAGFRSYSEPKPIGSGLFFESFK